MCLHINYYTFIYRPERYNKTEYTSECVWEDAARPAAVLGVAVGGGQERLCTHESGLGTPRPSTLPTSLPLLPPS